VAVLGRTPEKLARVVERVELTGGVARKFVVELRCPADVNRAIDDAAGWLQGIDVLVNNAGVYRGGAFAETTDHTIDELVDIDFKGLVYVSRAAIRSMKSGGCIVNIASMSGIRALDQQSIYAAVKAAVIHLGTCLARELAPFGIRVNTVSPGPTKTPIIETVAPKERVPEIEAALTSIIPLRRLGNTNEIAEAVAYLASATFATGTHLVLDGGTIL
jgi:NAD(P)-dependent dehydrogenase (short-subunit alcohol dehydrogenase family)